MKEVKILFSPKPEWESSLRKQLSAYDLSFIAFDQVDFDHYDYIFPLGVDVLKYCKNFPLAGKAIFPSSQAIEVCDNRLAFKEFMANAGFGSLLPPEPEDNEFPYVLKGKYSCWGHGVELVSSAAEEALFVDKNHDQVVRQSFIGGTKEYASHIMMHDRRIVFQGSVVYDFPTNYFIKGHQGNPITSTIIDHSHLRPVFTQILQAIGFNGICCIDYKIIDGKLKIFEINPRFGATMTFFLDKFMPLYMHLCDGDDSKLLVQPA